MNRRRTLDPPTIGRGGTSGPRHTHSPIVRGRYQEPELNHRVGNGGQGRIDSRSESGQRSCPKGEDRRRPIRVNRSIDTRIFSSSESPVRHAEAEDAERVFAAPTEPPSPTEPMPSPTRGRRPSGAVSSRSARASAHRDRAGTELCTSRPAFGRDGDQSDSCRKTRMSCAVASNCRWLCTVVSKRVMN
jgi:hypothetical protein